MTTRKIIQKSILVLIMIATVYAKIVDSNPSPWREISTDLVIVLILLGIGEIILAIALSHIIQFTKQTFQFLKKQTIIMKEPIKQLMVGLLLLATGLLSPSNGIDDKVNRDPVQMLIETILIIAAAITLYLILQKFFLSQKYRLQK
jgi:hypothetical protein